MKGIHAIAISVGLLGLPLASLAMEPETRLPNISIEFEGAGAPALTGEIELLAWSWGSASTQRGACVQDLAVTKYVGSSSPILLLSQVEGRVFDKMVLSVRDPRAAEPSSADHDPFLVITFEDVSVDSLSAGGSSTGEIRPVESLGLKFSSANYEFSPQNLADVGFGEASSATIYSNPGCR